MKNGRRERWSLADRLQAGAGRGVPKCGRANWRGAGSGVALMGDIIGRGASFLEASQPHRTLHGPQLRIARDGKYPFDVKDQTVCIRDSRAVIQPDW